MRKKVLAILLGMAGSIAVESATTAPSGQAQPGTAAPAGAVYQKYEPKATPVAAPTGPAIRKLAVHETTWSVVLLGGMSLPLDTTAKYNNPSFGGNFEVLYAAAKELSIDFFFHYSMLPYKDAAADKPMMNMGAGVKAVVPLFDLEGINPYIDAGMGYYFSNVATQNVVGKTEAGEPITETKYRSSSGMGFNGGFGLRYKLNPNFSVILDLGLVTISLEGGTADALLYALTTAGMAYTF